MVTNGNGFFMTGLCSKWVPLSTGQTGSFPLRPKSVWQGASVVDAPLYQTMMVENLYSMSQVLEEICLTSVTCAKCGIRSTLCWKVGNISGPT